MKKNILSIFTLFCCLLATSSCNYDNFDEPKSMFTGRATYDGEAVNISSNGRVQFNIFQDGFGKYDPIPVYLNQDGEFSATLFNGNYKLVRMGNAPWERPSNDTIHFSVHGNTALDIPVIPYFIIKDATFSKEGSKVKATFKIKKVSESATLKDVCLYIGKTLITSSYTNIGITSLGNSVAMDTELKAEIDIPSNMENEGFIYARIGVHSNQASEACYTKSTKIELK